MIDRAAMTLMWRSVSSGQKGSEVMERWQNHEDESEQKQIEVMDAAMRINPRTVENADDKLAAKLLKELENG